MARAVPGKSEWGTLPSPSAKIDTTVPVSARIWNYWLGGKDYYPVDKEAGDQFAQIYPGIFDSARASRYFIARVVRYLAGEAGIRQFLDIGTGLPSHDSTHEVAQRVAPDSRIVYVDNDPLVLAHARALLAGNAEGSTDYIDADLNDPDALLAIAREKLDFSRPVAIMLMGVLAHIGNPEQDNDRVAQSIVSTLKAALPSGGYLAIYDSSNVDPGLSDALRKYNESGAAPYRLRRPDQIARFFDGLELADPGVVRIQQWRPDHTPFGPPEDLSSNMGGVGRKAKCPLPPRAIMDLPEIRSERDDRVPGYEQAGPMAVRMLLGLYQVGEDERDAPPRSRAAHDLAGYPYFCLSCPMPGNGIACGARVSQHSLKHDQAARGAGALATHFRSGMWRAPACRPYST